QTCELSHALPCFYDRTYLWIGGEAGVELRPVGMVQNIHHVSPADAGRIIKARLLVATRLQILDAVLRVCLHLLLGPEDDRLSGAGLGAGGPLPDCDSVGAQGAFVGGVVDPGDARDIERAALHAITAADAVLMDEVDDAVGVLHDRAGRRARFEAAGLGAMHAAVLADQPFEV